jgi:hypothetical protein
VLTVSSLLKRRTVGRRRILFVPLCLSMRYDLWRLIFLPMRMVRTEEASAEDQELGGAHNDEQP